jgi:hypothetical protein
MRLSSWGCIHEATRKQEGKEKMSDVHDLGEQRIEQAIQQAGKTAPRLTPESIDATIANAQYYVFPGTTLTVCCLTLRNGYNVTGESASVSPDNFDADIGKQIARAEARDKIWQLEGYLLKERTQ